MIVTAQQITDQFKRVEVEQAKLKTLVLDHLIMNHPENNKDSISDIRKMGSMQMIETILEQTTSQRTTEFVQGLKDHLNSRGTLSESQRFHLESTYSSINNTES